MASAVVRPPPFPSRVASLSSFIISVPRRMPRTAAPPRHLARSLNISQDGDSSVTAAAAEDAQSDGSESPMLDPRRFEEKFAVLNTGVYECRSCGYKYSEAVGDPSYPIAPGLPFAQLPDDWRCPTCGAATSFFESRSVEVAGFAQNQQYGLGGNSLTAGQKAVLIYGGLAAGFLFFLSGYFLQ